MRMKKDEQWQETVFDLITDPQGQDLARAVLENQTVDELRKLVRHFRSLRNTGLTGLATAGLNKAACVDWLLGTPGVEFC